MAKKITMARVAGQEAIADGIFSIWLSFSEQEDLSIEAKAGQFVSLFCQDGSRLLPRPISICEILKNERKIRLVYRLFGEGTKEFSKLRQGDQIKVLGPLGNGFTLQAGKSIIIGGGIGIPPMLELAKSLSEQGETVQAVLGYRDKHLFLDKEFLPYADVYISTEDGSAGTKGNVIDAIRENELSAQNIYACGPLPMLRGVKAFAIEQKIPAQISMEEKMACGIGACLACICQTGEKDAHSNVNNKRVCKDGPVFDAREIML